MAALNDREQAWAVLMGDRTIPRWTQDSPIRPSVWAEFLTGDDRVPLLMTPVREVAAGQLYSNLSAAKGCPSLIYNQSTVASRMTFHEMLQFALPKSKWWNDVGRGEMRRCAKQIGRKKGWESWLKTVEDMTTSDRRAPLRSSFLYFLLVVGIIELRSTTDERAEEMRLSSLVGGEAGTEQRVMALKAQCLALGYQLLRSSIDLRVKTEPQLFAISVDRQASIAALPSARTIKADAARQLFSLDFSDIRWAVLDTGVDVTHPAFVNLDDDKPAKKAKKKSSSKKKSKRGSRSATKPAEHRITETYDFTLLKTIMELATSPDHSDRTKLTEDFGVDADLAQGLCADLIAGREIDWDQLSKAIRVDKPENWDALHPHGTHVAGVLGAGPYKSTDDDFESPEERKGMCPNIRIVDVRVLDSRGRGDEFSIIAALQYIRHRNANKEKPIIQGVNMSLQLPHDVRNYACGQTPLCEEVDRLAGAGIVAVAAAGNMGFGKTGPQVATGGGGYQDISIMDPGNADTAITVGSTHSDKPHRYGVSFFSGRGPTGDGRQKPDIVAPGEKIVGPVPGGGSETMDGTSQAAPHVSAAAAMLMARNNELIGQPQRIKEILCDNATDLGRERYFQGKGLVDVLRAMQSI